MTTQQLTRTQLPIDLYGRVSRKPAKSRRAEQVRGARRERTRSVDGQLRDAEARVVAAGLPVGERFRDDGVSAWNPKAKRKDWDRLMTRLETGVSGGVCVWELARFTRRPIEGERLIAAAERGLVVMSAESDFDLRRPEDRKQFRELLVSAAYESDMTSAKSARGKRLNALDGVPNHSWRPYGFEDDGITIRESEAVFVREAAQRIVDGELPSHVVAYLNEAGSRTSTGRLWDHVLLRQMLLNPRLAGHVVYRGEIVGRMPGEPLLEPELWDRVVAVYAGRSRGRPNSEQYLLSGEMHCSLCWVTVNGRPRNNMKPYEDGGVRRQYWCVPRIHKGGCGRVAIDQRAADHWVRSFVATVLSDREVAAARAAAADGRHADVERIRAEMRRLEDLAETLAARLGRGEITLARHDAAVGPLDRRIAHLRPQMAEAEGILLSHAPLLPDVEPDVAAILARWDAPTTSTADRRALLRGALNGDRLVVMPGRAVDGRMRVVPRDEVGGATTA